jgi:hypothetical protein
MTPNCRCLRLGGGEGDLLERIAEHDAGYDNTSLR